MANVDGDAARAIQTSDGTLALHTLHQIRVRFHDALRSIDELHRIPLAEDASGSGPTSPPPRGYSFTTPSIDALLNADVVTPPAPTRLLSTGTTSTSLPVSPHLFHPSVSPQAGFMTPPATRAEDVSVSRPTSSSHGHPIYQGISPPDHTIMEQVVGGSENAMTEVVNEGRIDDGTISEDAQDLGVGDGPIEKGGKSIAAEGVSQITQEREVEREVGDMPPKRSKRPRRHPGCGTGGKLH